MHILDEGQQSKPKLPRLEVLSRRTFLLLLGALTHQRVVSDIRLTQGWVLRADDF
jgi:hypothetical protein